MKKGIVYAAAFAVAASLYDSPIPAKAQSFGSAVAVSGDEIIAGVGRNSARPGTLYLYKRLPNGTWTESGQLSADGATEADGFGRALATYDNTMAVGAPLAGMVYVYTKDSDGRWNETGRISSEVESFGGAVGIYDDLLVVGAPGGRDADGSAFAYHRSDEGSWELTGTLLAQSQAERGRYAGVVSVSGDRVAVSEPGADNSTGVVHMFSYDASSNTWSADGAISNPGLDEGAQFGSAVVLVGDHMVVGIPGYENRTGAAAVFHLNGESGEWEFRERISAFTARPGEQFGSSLAFGGGRLWVGAPGYDSRHGVVFTFTPDEASERLTASALFTAMDIQSSSSFGSAIAVGEDVAAFGASGYDRRSGAVIPFAASNGVWEQGNVVFHDEIPYPSVTGGMVECHDGKAGDFSCSDVNMVSMLSVRDLGGDRGVSTNDIWGWEDAETGHEYAIVGMSNAASFVDVTDASNPFTVGTLPMTKGARASVWRDMKVYKEHVFVVSDGAGPHGMQVFDLRRLRNVQNPPVVFDEDAHYGNIASAHNVVINEETGYAYIVGSASGGETCGGGLHMVNIQEPTHPTFAGCFSDGTTGRRGTGYSHDAQCIVYHGPDSAYRGHEICLGSNETALSIADVTDKENPVSISIATYPKVAYTHQGWLTEDQRYFYMNDELDEPQGLVDGTRTLIWDVSDLDEPVLAAEHIAKTSETDHNLYIKGNMMYQSNYGAGFRVLDITNREDPVEVAYFDTDPTGGGSSWSNYPYFKSGVVIVTGGGNGLFVLKKREVDI